MAAADDLDRVIERYHQAADEFARGNPDPVKNLYSSRDDVAIANPFFPLTRGRERVVERLERSVQNFRDGEVGFEKVVEWMSDELACLVELEEWRTKVGGREDVTPFTLRVTTLFRAEDGEWKVVHRHADPITSARPAESVIPE
ncbi:MAG: nuclear transport factor 2 family protein [Actinomycetota bacterium]|nr:nuclear transport factor 2 family protein [Actinomycetota bacterium]